MRKYKSKDFNLDISNNEPTEILNNTFEYVTTLISTYPEYESVLLIDTPLKLLDEELSLFLFRLLDEPTRKLSIIDEDLKKLCRRIRSYLNDVSVIASLI